MSKNVHNVQAIYIYKLLSAQIIEKVDSLSHISLFHMCLGFW